MELKEYCIKDECDYFRQCKHGKQKSDIKCPVFAFSSKREPLYLDENRNYYGSPVIKCPSCGCYYRMPINPPKPVVGAVIFDELWGQICGYCLYEFAERGYPMSAGGGKIKHLKKIGFDNRPVGYNHFKAWDIK